MRVRAVLTDLDGTVLEPDGSLLAETAAEIHRLTREDVPVCVVTSKTPAEVRATLRRLRLSTPAGFENGAGLVLADGTEVLGPAAVPLATLRTLAELLRSLCREELRTFDELSDDELAELTGLSPGELAAARDRRATLPLLVGPSWDERLREALPHRPRLRLLRGNRFLHLQGDHHKGSVSGLLLDQVAPVAGAVVCCGDSPNDLELLAAADVAVIVPSATGPHPELLVRLPGARIAPAPHGRGWALAMRRIVTTEEP